MLRNLTIGKRFIAASALLCVLAALLAAVGYAEIRALRGRLVAVPALIDTRLAVAQWQGETASNAARTVAVLRSADTELGAKLNADMKAVSGRISVLQKRIEALPLSERTKARFAEVGSARGAYIALRDEMLRLRPAPEFGGTLDTRFITGLGTVGERMLILVDIERLMGSEDMQLIDARTRAGA